MGQHTPAKPSFVFGYWRPWKESANYFDSYLDYVKDTSLVKYGADTLGNYINQASQEQVVAINRLGQSIGRGMNILSSQMSEINSTMTFINRNLDLQLEQQKLTNLLLQNIAELLRVPDSEKERQHNIELGIKFFINASKDSDLYQDALEELLKAELKMKQDYFVLHRIGCIYLYVENHLDPEKALDYFLRAAKYASVEDKVNAVRLVNALTKNFNSFNSKLNDSTNEVGLLASDSFDKAAYSSYILGDFEGAVKYQSKVIKINDSPVHRFQLAKYQARLGNTAEAIKNLDIAISSAPSFFDLVSNMRELDLATEPIIQYLIGKNERINSELLGLEDKWRKLNSVESDSVILDLKSLINRSYEEKISKSKEYLRQLNKLVTEYNHITEKIEGLIRKVNNNAEILATSQNVEDLLDQLESFKNMQLEHMRNACYDLELKIDKVIYNAKAKNNSNESISKEQIRSDRTILDLCAKGRFNEAIAARRGFSHASNLACENYVRDLCIKNSIKFHQVNEKESRSEGSSPNCFVITATMGDADHPVVQTFREYRDRELLTTHLGTFFVLFYYRVGPLVAKIISQSNFLKRLSFKLIVNPIYHKIRK